MARKIIKNLRSKDQKSFNKEKDNLTRFKNCLAHHDNIINAFATFLHGSNFNIIYPYADLDLHTFLYGRKESGLDYYSGFLERSAAFTPPELFNEAASLADALNHLHRNLHPSHHRDGGNVSCAHLDLKPENVLVDWSSSVGDIRSDTTSTIVNKPVGRWLLTDFGLSIIRPLDAHGTSQEAAVVGPTAIGDVIEERREQSMKPPRDEGPFQPPEMKRHQDSKVSTQSDMWSFGCMLAMILAFALGGPMMVIDLLRVREGAYSNDFFYTSDASGTKRKVEIDQWLDNCKVVFPDHVAWISPCVALIKDLLNVERSGRKTKAHQAYERLQEIAREAERNSFCRQRLWSLPQITAQSPSISHATGSPRPIRRPETVPTRPPDATTKNPILSEDQWRENYRDESDVQPRAGRLIAASNGPTYFKFRVPPNPLKAFSSTCGKRLAFMSTEDIMVYFPNAIDAFKDEWPSERKAKSMSDSYTPKTFPCPRGRSWKDVQLAGAFLALISHDSNHKVLDCHSTVLYHILTKPRT